MRDARLLTQFNEIVDCITNGWPVPGEYYRSQIDDQGDRLLGELGVKHLHLGGQGSDVILYVAEFPDWVELLEINGHVHLESEPRGRDLKGRFTGHARTAGTAVAGVVIDSAAAKGSSRKTKKPKRKSPRRS